MLEAQEGLQDRLLITIHLAVLWMAGCTEEAVCTRGLLRPASARRPPGNTCTRQPLWEPTPVSSYLEISEAESIGWDQTPLQWAMWICHLCNQNLGRHSTSFGKWLHVTSWALQLWTVPLRLPSLRMQEWSLDMKGQFPQHSLWRAVRTVRICCTSRREQWCHLYQFSDSDALQLDWYRLAMVNSFRITHFRAKPTCSFWMHFCFCICFESIAHNSLYEYSSTTNSFPSQINFFFFF